MHLVVARFSLFIAFGKIVICNLVIPVMLTVLLSSVITLRGVN